MADNRGWIKSYRSLLENPILTKSTGHMAVWVYLTHTATSKKRKTLFKGREIELKPGQLIVGRKKIAEKFKDLNESKVQRILKDFENAQQIEQQTSPQNRLITLKNWDKYQASEQQTEQRLNNERTTTEQRLNNERTHNKNVKKEKNVKNVEKRERALSPHGRFENVLLTANELNELIEKYPEEYSEKIERLSRYLETTGKRYNNHFATLMQWLSEDVKQNSQNRATSYDIEELDKISILD